MRRAFFLCLIGVCLTACQKPANSLPSVQQSHELVVITHNGPATYFVNGENAYAGLEYDLAKRFAAYLTEQSGQEVRLKIVVADNIGQIIPSLLKGKAHLAAANLSITHLREHLVRFGPSYQTVQQQVVYRKNDNKPPRTLTDLAGGSLAVPAGTSYAERLSEGAADAPGLTWQVVQANSEDLLERVADGVLDYTIADSPLVAMEQNYFPDLAAAFDFGLPDRLAWAFPKTGDDWLYQQATHFFERIQQDGTLDNLLDRYYGHSERLKGMDVSTFMVNMRTLLPRYIGMFKQAQEISGIDWRLLAAISYQESHWDALATSPTNVRGIMMLTEETADRMGVTNRLDPRQSIIAGARYLLTLKELIPQRVPEPDRTWMALAAYNIGVAHLEDARILAQRMKLNPDAWSDLKKTLPLLSKDAYFNTLKYGFARGGAPVVFVESIRTYHNILQRYEPAHRPVLPSFNLASFNTRATMLE